MRNYQTLTLIGSILGILIAFAVIGLLGVLDIGITSFENLTDRTQERADVQKRETINRHSIYLYYWRYFDCSLHHCNNHCICTKSKDESYWNHIIGCLCCNINSDWLFRCNWFCIAPYWWNRSAKIQTTTNNSTSVKPCKFKII